MTAALFESDAALGDDRCQGDARLDGVDLVPADSQEMHAFTAFPENTVKTQNRELNIFDILLFSQDSSILGPWRANEQNS